MSEFINKIENYYKKIPYHNSLHAIDVTSSVAFFLLNGLTVFNRFD